MFNILFRCIGVAAEYGSSPEDHGMTKVELVARTLAASRTGRADDWGPFRADALLVLAAFGQADGLLSGTVSHPILSLPANDR
jgi:hypothetical protein